MRIGIDCRTLLNPGHGEGAGVGHYTYLLVKHLLALDTDHEFALFFDYRVRDLREFERSNVHVHRFAFSQYKRFLPFTYSHMLITGLLLKERLDVFHSPANVLPLTYRRPSVITVHDLAIYKNPAWFPAQIFSTKLLVPQSLRAARHIIAVSQSTKDDLREIFGVPGTKVTVIHEAPFVAPINVKDRNVDVLEKFKLSKPYILFVGTVDPRKNLETLLEALLLLRRREDLKNVQLVLAGAKGYKHEEVFDRISQLKLAKAVRYVGYVTHNEKLQLYKHADVFAFPSLYEGFGLPVVEAMSMGTPVVAARTASIPELAGKAALLVNPENTKELAGALQQVLTSPEQAGAMIKRGLVQAQLFDWEMAARKTLAVYERVGYRRSKG